MSSTQKTFRFAIGGRVVAVEGEAASMLAANEAFVRFASEGKPQWRVLFDCQVETPPRDAILLSEFFYEETDSRCLFLFHGEDYYYSMLSAVDGRKLVAMHFKRGSDEVHSTSVNDFNALRFSLWFAVTMLAAPLRLTFIHSSAVVYDRRVVLFLGESGTGKSTHARLWLKNIEGSHLLNDDSPAIEVGDTIKIHGSSWSGKTPCYIPLTFPLAAVVRLSQAQHNAIRPLSVPKAFGAIHPSLPPALVQDDYFADLMIDIVSAVISKVPVYHLECLPDADAARLSFNTIFGK